MYARKLKVTLSIKPKITTITYQTTRRITPRISMNEEESDDNDSTLIKPLVFLTSISRSKIRSSRRKVPISTLIENRKTKKEKNIKS